MYRNGRNVNRLPWDRVFGIPEGSGYTKMDDLVQVMVWVVALGPVGLDSWGPLVLKGNGDSWVYPKPPT